MTAPSLDPELSYLATLTRAGLKPLSRWERPWDEPTRAAIEQHGLITRPIHRSAQSGRPVRELVFSRDQRYVDLYARRFDRRPLDRTPSDRRIEGWLFGYPSCCVESFLAHGYRPNALRRRDQRLLFHWACPRCTLTPLLVPQYRRLYRARGRSDLALPLPIGTTVRRSLHRGLAMAASLAALGSLAPASIATPPPDSHQVPLNAWLDADLDGLKDTEELIMGLDPAVADQNRNGVADGPDWACALSLAIDRLPEKPSTATPYRIANFAFGLETCSVCGEAVNMGFYEIVNPLENLRATVPCIAKHYLEHGAFAYAGSVHSGRLNPPLLRTALQSQGLAHFLPEDPALDSDNDGLRDGEEALFGTRPDAPDTDGDGLRDGIDAARSLRARLEGLPRFGRPEDGPTDRPFVVPHPMNGIETCPRCGETVTMDIWHVYNHLGNGFIAIPSMALHSLEHGAFRWEGGQLAGGKGRVDPRHLESVLDGTGNGHQTPVSPDSDNDSLTDPEEHDLNTSPTQPDENSNGTPDGIDLALACAAQVAALPTKPDPNGIYRLDFQLKGLEQCAICGTNVNMGHLAICNPRAGLYAPVPYIALHHLEHGSFCFASDVHGTGRLDPLLLTRALDAKSPSHLVAADPDQDADALADAEEKHFGTNPALADTDTDGVPDGFAVARDLWQTIVSLTRAPAAPVHAIDHLLRGLVTCPVCGAQENMGWIEIVNTREQLTANVSYLALHYLRHGSFGDGDARRINPRLVAIALRGDGASHHVSVAGDSDADGLRDPEETALGTRPDIPDTNGDGVLDGVAAARSAFARIRDLPRQPQHDQPYALHAEADCYAPCPVCGVDVNCGHVELVQPRIESRLTLTYRLLHFLEHGSFAASTAERADPLQLEAYLCPSILLVSQGSTPRLEWFGAAHRKYQVQMADTLAGPWHEGPTYEGADARLTFTLPAGAPGPAQFLRVLAW